MHAFSTSYRLYAVLFASLLAATSTQAQAVYKCTDNGKVAYSEHPCKKGDGKENPMKLDHDRIGTVSPGHAHMDTSARTRFETRPNPSAKIRAKATTERQCDALNQKIAHIESSARQPKNARQQDNLAKQKRKAIQQKWALKC